MVMGKAATDKAVREGSSSSNNSSMEGLPRLTRNTSRSIITGQRRQVHPRPRCPRAAGALYMAACISPCRPVQLWVMCRVGVPTCSLHLHMLQFNITACTPRLVPRGSTVRGSRAAGPIQWGPTAAAAVAVRSSACRLRSDAAARCGRTCVPITRIARYCSMPATLSS